MIERYLSYSYRADARGEDGFIDCWGLTRLARNELYGKTLLPSYGWASLAAGSMHEAYQEQARSMRQCERREGAIVAVLRRGACVHVALMVGDNQVLEIKRAGQRARLTPWREFVRQYPQPHWDIRFYDD